MKVRQTLEDAVKNRGPHFIITNDPGRPGQVVMAVYEHGSGDTLARKHLDLMDCKQMVEKLIQPLVERSQGHWVGQHGYHP